MGELLAILSAISFAGANAAVKKGTTRRSRDNGAFLSIVMTGTLSALVFVALGLGRGWPALSGLGLLWFAIAGILTSFAGRTLLYASIQHIGAIRASAVKRLNPVFAVLIGVVFLGERLSLLFVAGMLLIFCSFIVLAWGTVRGERSAGEPGADEGGLDAAPGGAGAEGAAADAETAATGDPGAGPGDLGRGNPAGAVGSEAPGKGPGEGGPIHRVKRAVRRLLVSGYLYGPASSLAYAVGYMFRKMGLAHINDPYLGTALGAFIGVAAFVTMARFHPYYAAAIRDALGKWQPWLFFAGVATSVAQMLYFVALATMPVSRVAVLVSTEVIFSPVVAAWVVRTNETVSAATLGAIFMSLVGTVLIALG